MTQTASYPLPDRLGRVAPHPAAQPRDLVYWGFAFQILALVFLQKYVVPVAGVPISVPLLTLYAWLGVMLLLGRLHSSGLRMALVGMLFGTMTLSQVFVDQPLSLMSYLQFLMLYVPIVFVWRVPRDSFRGLMNVFQNAMLVGAAMVFLQLAWQMLHGLGNMPNLESVSPHSFLLQGYNYDAPIAWGERFKRPNGLFFLEPSFASSFLASALIIELTHFRRVWRMLIYVAALIGTVAVTGVVIVAVAAIPLLTRQSLRVAPFTLLAGAAGAGAAFWTGAMQRYSHRVTELNAPESSGWQRIIASLQQLRIVYGGDAANPLTGIGAGNSLKVNVSLWPVVKVMIEYGVVPGVLFVATLAVAMWGSLNAPLALGLFLAFNFTGGFLVVPASVLQILLLVTLLRQAQPTQDPRPAAPAPPHPAALRLRAPLAGAPSLRLRTQRRPAQAPSATTDETDDVADQVIR